MNKFKKYCPNVWVAECDEECAKGEIIKLETQYGKEVDCEVFNLITSKNNKFYYSIIRVEEKSYAERKAEKYHNASGKSTERSNQYYNASNEGREFLSLGEPVKVGHHSEKRHRALIERNNERMRKCIEEGEKADEQKRKAEYWESKTNDITLAMPESIGYFSFKLEQAIEYQIGLKSGKIQKEHSYSLTYATKAVKELTEKLKIAKLLWQ